MNSLKKFCKSQPVLLIVLIAAALTILFIPPDKEYFKYCNRTVLIQLFCLMAAVSGFRSVGIFEKATALLLNKAGNLRRLGVIFTLICFFSSMFFTNDVALLTFVPLTIIVYNSINDEKSKILTIVLETAAANLGSMLTPFGNPQNLFIYDEYHLSICDFLKTMFPSGMFSLGMLLLLNLLIPKKMCTAFTEENTLINKKKLTAYLILFIICLLTVFRVIPDIWCFGITIIAMLVLDIRLFAKIDYGLIGTFVCFFIFVGNIARIDAVSIFFSRILNEREIIVSVVLSQVISNVPAAVMLSGFTDNGTQLLLGVNLGGLGTVIASLASLISFQFYRKSEKAQSGCYMIIFTAVNFGLLTILMGFTLSGIL